MHLPPPFRHRNFRLFYAAQFISLLGLWLEIAAQSWLVYTLTGSALLLGVTAAVSSVPGLLCTMWGGLIADRFDKRKILIWCQLLAMAPALALGFLVASGLVRYFHVLCLALWTSLVTAIEVPTRQSFIVELVERDELASASALNLSIFNTTRIFGPAAAGLLVARLGTAVCFFLNAASFLAPLVMFQKLELDPSPLAIRRDSPWQDFTAGWRYVRASHLVRQLIALRGITGVLTWGVDVTLPIFARDVLAAGPGGYGFLIASAGVGALLGSLMLSRSGPHGRPRRLVGGLALFCVSMLAFAWSRSFPLSAVLEVVAGGAAIVHFATSNAWLQDIVPDALRGRVLGIDETMSLGFRPIGGFMCGALASRLGAPLGVSVAMVATALVAAAAWRGFRGSRLSAEVVRAS